MQITIKGKIGEGKSTIMLRLVEIFHKLGFTVHYRDVNWKNYTTKHPKLYKHKGIYKIKELFIHVEEEN